MTELSLTKTRISFAFNLKCLKGLLTEGSDLLPALSDPHDLIGWNSGYQNSRNACNFCYLSDVCMTFPTKQLLRTHGQITGLRSCKANIGHVDPRVTCHCSPDETDRKHHGGIMPFWSRQLWSFLRPQIPHQSPLNCFGGPIGAHR